MSTTELQDTTDAIDMLNAKIDGWKEDIADLQLMIATAMRAKSAIENALFKPVK